MRNLLILLSFLLIQQCDAQKQSAKTEKKRTTKNNKMSRPSINNKFETLNLDDYKNDMKIEKEWSFSTKSYYDWYTYKKETENEIIGIDGNANAGLRYGKTLKNSIYVISKIYYWKSGYIKSKSIFTQLTGIRLGEEYQFDESGKLIKTIDHDKGWDFSYEKVLDFIGKNYNINPLEKEVTIKKGERKVKVAYDEDTDESTYEMRPYYQKYTISYVVEKKENKKGIKYWEINIQTDFKTTTEQTFDIIKLDALTGEILCYIEYEKEYKPNIGSTNTGMLINYKVIKTIVPDKTIPPSEKPSTVYKTYEGKGYTKEEWVVFEQEYYNEYLRKTGRADLIKPTETPKTETKKSSFIADEDDVKPKKKGFWG